MKNIKAISNFEVEKAIRNGYVVFKLTKRMSNGTSKYYHAFVNEFGTFGEKCSYGVSKCGYSEYREPLSHEMLLKVVRLVEKY